LILDDLASLADLEDLWPAGPAGQVVITTGLPDAAFPPGPRIAPVGRFSRREVLAYLSSRLTDFPDQRAEALDLGADLDGLPLTLGQAAAVMSLNRLSCREEAIEHYRRLVAGSQTAGGRDHREAHAACAHLAAAHRQASEPKDAIALYQRVLADHERIAGPDHPDAITARASLAAAYQQAGRLTDAIHHYEQALADSERYLGLDHPLTRTVRDNLDAATRG
jgi:tetratricopeptide (TPR) repeat protein